MPVNANGVPFDMSHIYATGNIAADMMANVTAEGGGRVLASRLYNMTDDAGMKDMLSFLIARDTMHQQQWLAVIEELGGMQAACRSRTRRRRSHEATEHSLLLPQHLAGRAGAGGPLDVGPVARRQVRVQRGRARRSPRARSPTLGKAKPNSGAQKEQM